MKKKTAVSLGMLSLALAAGLLTACGSDQKTGAEEGSGEDNKLYVYNWGAAAMGMQAGASMRPGCSGPPI